jgi:hypothetical protein
MKFARSLQESEQPELHALYKQLKKSLRILDEPADARSAVEAPHSPSPGPSSISTSSLLPATRSATV